MMLTQLTSRSSVAEVEAACRASGRMSVYDYARDLHFSAYVFNDIHTWQEALAFADQLDADRKRQDAETTWGRKEGICQKTWQIRAWLKKPFWRQGNHWKLVLASARRICCCCHETGSYALNCTKVKHGNSTRHSSA